MISGRNGVVFRGFWWFDKAIDADRIGRGVPNPP